MPKGGRDEELQGAKKEKLRFGTRKTEITCSERFRMPLAGRGSEGERERERERESRLSLMLAC